MKKFYLIFLLGFIVNESYAQPSFIKDSVDAYVNRALEMWQIPGAAVCIVKDGKVVLAKGYGITEINRDEAVDANTLFMIGSNTKAFTGTALALLENEGRINLEDKVQKFLPDFTMKDAWIAKELNLIDIVTHRMGMETFQGDAMYWTSDLTPAEVINKFGRLTPAYGFRTRYGYTNAGYAIAGEVIKNVTDTSWNDYIRSRIFKPLNMNRSTALSEEYFKADNIAKAHTFVENNMEVIPFKKIDNLAPAGSIGSSAADIANWMIAQLDSGKLEGQQVLPFKVIQRTRQPFTITGRNRHPFNKTHYNLYGLGWVLEDYEGKEIISHTGGVNGFVTSVTLIPEENLGIAVFTNTDQNYFFLALRWEITDAYLNLDYRNYNQVFHNGFSKNRHKLMKNIAELRDSAAMNIKPDFELARFTGKYEHEVYGNIDISEVNDNLQMRFQHHSSLTAKLESIGNNRFLCTFNDPTYGVVVIPFKVKDDRVISFILSVDPFVEFTTYEFIKK
jgi:CubicO group peptidase (beta-lactamase class C family)